jgi:hypothetical protein
MLLTTLGLSSRKEALKERCQSRSTIFDTPLYGLPVETSLGETQKNTLP